MIKRLLLACCFFCPAFAQAQIVLDSSDMGSIGQSVIMQFDTSYTGTTGSMGAAQTWNFTGLTATAGLQDTIKFLSPASIPNGPNVPNANMVMQTAGQNMYMQKTATKLDILALNVQFDTLINGLQKLTPPMRYIDFPATYLYDNYSNTSFQITLPFDTVVPSPFGNINVDSMRLTITNELFDTINGYGTLLMPWGIEPALRQHSRQKVSLSAEAGANIPFIGFTWIAFPLPLPDLYSSTFRFFGKGKKYPLVEITTDSAGTVQGASFQSQSVVSLQQRIEYQSKISVYPNPASDHVQIESKASEAVVLQLYDLSGRMVGHEKSVQPGNTTLDLSSIESGTYILKFINRKGEMHHFQKIVKQ